MQDDADGDLFYEALRVTVMLHELHHIINYGGFVSCKIDEAAAKLADVFETMPPDLPLRERVHRIADCMMAPARSIPLERVSAAESEGSEDSSSSVEIGNGVALGIKSVIVANKAMYCASTPAAASTKLTQHHTYKTAYLGHASQTSRQMHNTRRALAKPAEHCRAQRKRFAQQRHDHHELQNSKFSPGPRTSTARMSTATHRRTRARTNLLKRVDSVAILNSDTRLRLFLRRLEVIIMMKLMVSLGASMLLRTQ
ncbi:hypothetical protein JKP88DRAFT_255818 [Tribonema minus]|uniref:Uncharacterized protein n=1 Tax=Tribonema minus TaxID=303371 RepID=A0A835YZ76_9STRA|nr:hypothetical protein JKP88DRAFT_255818 [Tribonema minus]